MAQITYSNKVVGAGATGQFSTADANEIKTVVNTNAAQLPPDGGLATQILAKASDNDYDYVWVNQPTGSGSGGGTFVWRGPWSNVTAYAVDDVVERNGSAYVATAPTTGQDPDGGADWDLMVAAGAPGAPGAPGDPGDPGAPGDDGLSVLTGAGAPVVGLGVDGQVYIDTVPFKIYKKSSGTWDAGTAMLPETVQSWMDNTADAAILATLYATPEFNWSSGSATVTGWGELRMHADPNYFYIGYTDDIVIRIPLVAASTGGSAFNPNDVLTRRIKATSTSVGTTTGLAGDEFVTSATDEIGGMTVTFTNQDPATGIGWRKPSGAKYWELVAGGGTVEFLHTLHSSNATTDKLRSPFTGPWFIGIVFEYAGQIGDQFAKIAAGGNKGGKFETVTSKAAIRLDSTFRDLDGVAADSGGIQCVFSENWVVGQKYFVGIARTHDGKNFACLGKVSPTAKPGQLEVRSPNVHPTTGVYYIDKMENLDGNELIFEFATGTKFYDSFYRAGAVDLSLASDLFSYSLTEYGA